MIVYLAAAILLSYPERWWPMGGKLADMAMRAFRSRARIEFHGGLFENVQNTDFNASETGVQGLERQRSAGSTSAFSTLAAQPGVQIDDSNNRLGRRC